VFAVSSRPRAFSTWISSARDLSLSRNSFSDSSSGTFCSLARNREECRNGVRLEAMTKADEFLSANANAATRRPTRGGTILRGCDLNIFTMVKNSTRTSTFSSNSHPQNFVLLFLFSDTRRSLVLVRTGREILTKKTVSFICDMWILLYFPIINTSPQLPPSETLQVSIQIEILW